jgi:hypothetical protein
MEPLYRERRGGHKCREQVAEYRCGMPLWMGRLVAADGLGLLRRIENKKVIENYGRTIMPITLEKRG